VQQDEHKNLPVWQFENLAQWRKWLKKNWDKEPAGIWVKLAKKGKDITTTNYEDTREGCLCYGWIDSTPNKLDDTFYLLKVTPRRNRSVWSKINVALCEQYIKKGKMRPSGLVQIEAAKSDGRWDKAY
jgi:uncharacterized protein YdeI (YjbR/CyaY-like superfamily)